MWQPRMSIVLITQRFDYFLKQHCLPRRLVLNVIPGILLLPTKPACNGHLACVLFLLNITTLIGFLGYNLLVVFIVSCIFPFHISSPSSSPLFPFSLPFLQTPFQHSVRASSRARSLCALSGL